MKWFDKGLWLCHNELENENAIYYNCWVKSLHLTGNSLPKIVHLSNLKAFADNK